MKAFRTAKAPSEIEYVVQKSRFIGRCFPIQAEAEALSVLEALRKRHWDASHNCYAYALGENASTARYSDDGEPGGTAGLPMMEVLKAQGLTDLLVVVTRYFGGVLLGAGGLVRAYSKATAEAIRAAGVVEMLPSRELSFSMPYPIWGKLESKLRGGDFGRCAIETPEFGAAVFLRVTLREDEAQRFADALVEATDGRVSAEFGAISHRAWDI